MIGQNFGFNICCFKCEPGHLASKCSKPKSCLRNNILIKEPMNEINHIYDDDADNDKEILHGDGGTTLVIRKKIVNAQRWFRKRLKLH